MRTTPHHLVIPSTRRTRTIAAWATAALIASAIALPSAVLAAPNPNIVVGNVTLSPMDQQATVGDVLTVSGKWDASDAAPQSGDTFTIGLPPELSFPQAIPFTLSGTDDAGNPVIWGTCLTEPDTGAATCELTDTVEENPELVQGTWQFDVEATEATDSATVEFDLNGMPVAVELPGGGGIDDGIDLPGEVTKTGVMNQDNWSMSWTVDIPAANMIGQSTVAMRDVLGDGHEVCDPTRLRVQTVRGTTVVDVTDLVTTAPEPGDTAFDLVLAAPASGFDANVIYRVTYQTCTPDGRIDPTGTTYDNSAQINGWGDAGRGVGRVENKPWQVDLAKSGSVLGGGERNSKIAWTVVIPGDQLFGKDAFTVAETLGAGHEMCADTINGVRVTESYGPGTTLQRDITGSLELTTLTSTAQSFRLLFDIDDEELAFRASDYRYLLTYSTCVTSNELPTGGTAYANEVAIDGHVAGGEAIVPARNEGKGGRINSNSVTLDGVTHMPQTTLGWTVTIPGVQLEGQDVLTLTDVLSATQTVCEPGEPSGGPAAQLGLRVEARDQIQGGGLTTVDLTNVTDVTVDGQEIALEVAATDLPIPTGTSDGFSREYQYVITYTTCTASGGMDAPGTVYRNEISGSGVSYTTTRTQNNSGSGTGQGVPRGSVSIDKVLSDTPGAALVPDDAVFTVHVKEIDPTGKTQNEYDRRVPLDGTPVSGLNARGRGWTIELTEPSFPTIPGVAFGDPVFAEGPGVSVSDDGLVATASVNPGSNVSVVLANEARLGSISILKIVEGGAASRVDPDRRYPVTAQINTDGLGANVPAEPDRELNLTAGIPASLDDLPIGATVSFVEERPTDDDDLTWAAPVISPSSLTVTAAHTTAPATVTVTNTVERTVGTFSLTKRLTGAQADNPAVPNDVTITATWDTEGNPVTKTLTLPTDGTPVPFGEDLLIGTEVTITETPLADGSSIAWAAPVWSGDGVAVDGSSAVVTIGRDADATVTVENHAATSTAGISILKVVAGDAFGEVTADTEFPVTATWLDIDGTTQSRDLAITTTGPTPLGVDLPAGTVVTLTERTRPTIDTVVWGSVTLSGDGVTDAGDGSATVVVPDQQDDSVLVTVVNEATWADGGFSLTKTVEGIDPGDADVPATVPVTATWVDQDGEQSVAVDLPTDGESIDFPRRLPHGTIVTLTEDLPNNTERFTWNPPSWGGDRVTTVNGNAEVTIGAADIAAVSLVNTAVATTGTLRLTKTLSGDGADSAATTAFPVRLTWTDLLGKAQSRDVEIVAGSPIEVLDLPTGVELLVEERGAELPDGIHWAGVDWAAESSALSLDAATDSTVARVTLIGAGDDDHQLRLENTLEVAQDSGVRDDAPSGTGLAASGGDVVALTIAAVGAVVVLILGLLLYVRTHRRGR